MFDTFEVIHGGGAVLWSRETSNEKSKITDIVNTYMYHIADRDDEETPPLTVNQHTVRCTRVKDLQVFFVVVYRSLLHISWIDQFLDRISHIFADLYGDQIRKPLTVKCNAKDFHKYYDPLLLEFESLNRNEARQNATAKDFPIEDETISGNLGQPPMAASARFTRNGFASLKDDFDTATGTDHSRPSSSQGLSGLDVPGQKLSRRQRKAANALMRTQTPTSDASRPTKPKKAPKRPRMGRAKDADGNPIWIDLDARDAEREAARASDAAGTDTENDAAQAAAAAKAVEGINPSQFGRRAANGRFVMKNLGDDVPDEEKPDGLAADVKSYISGMYRYVVGGRVLTKEEIKTTMAALEDHLLKKNVARVAAQPVCAAVSQKLIGTAMDQFESIQAKAQSLIEEHLRKMLTPRGHLDILREIDAVVKPPATSFEEARPYVISMVGVNGVGKSTNLAKLCYYFLQNKYKVLIVAGDTFRSGAVEQLKVHVRNLKELTAREGGHVEIFEKGYGKDPSAVAKTAVRHAADNGFDIVLVDTAGRRHNDPRLMGDLEKFARAAKPDKIFMVAEALVGSDAVGQAQHFNEAFGATRGLDGFLVSKCDTVGDMMGTIVNLVHATGVPACYLGTGQHYTDIRTFEVEWAVRKLLSPVGA